MTPYTNFDKPLPNKLVSLIEAGFWPKSHSEMLSQNVNPLIPDELVRRSVPQEYRLYLFKPPFKTVKNLCQAGEEIWIDLATEFNLDVSELLVIADFGLGSEGMLVLDYQASETSPRVIRLEHLATRVGRRNECTNVAKNFDEFCELMKIP